MLTVLRLMARLLEASLLLPELMPKLLTFMVATPGFLRRKRAADHLAKGCVVPAVLSGSYRYRM